MDSEYIHVKKIGKVKEFMKKMKDFDEIFANYMQVQRFNYLEACQ